MVASDIDWFPELYNTDLHEYEVTGSWKVSYYPKTTELIFCSSIYCNKICESFICQYGREAPGCLRGYAE